MRMSHQARHREGREAASVGQLAGFGWGRRLVVGRSVGGRWHREGGQKPAAAAPPLRTLSPAPCRHEPGGSRATGVADDRRGVPAVAGAGSRSHGLRGDGHRMEAVVGALRPQGV